MKGYLSIREAAEKWGVSERRVNQYCAEGRIGAAGKPVLCRGAYSRSAAFRYLVGNSGYCKQAG